MKVARRNYGMAPTPEEVGQCLRKHAYVNKRLALAAEKENARIYRKPFRAYPCPWCTYWHLTSQPV